MKEIANKLAYTFAYVYLHIHPEMVKEGGAKELYSAMVLEFGMAMRDQVANVLTDIAKEAMEAKHEKGN